MIYFNENDSFAAKWLANLFPSATIDQRSIVDVEPADVVRFERCHFFGGIGGWQLALQLAGWSGPVWTGSCPCQPLSCAGRRAGEDDERHLWPEFYRLIGECRPATISFGLAVANGPEFRPIPSAGEQPEHEQDGRTSGPACWMADAANLRSAEHEHEGRATEQPGGASTWAHWLAIPCADGRARRISAEPGDVPLAPRIPVKLGPSKSRLRRMGASARANRVGRLRGYGNAIVPAVAARFVRAVRQIMEHAA